jgi:hypothetical protein
MFFSLVLLRPHRATLPLIMLCHLLFHGFTFLAMAKRIGFVFPAAMLCSELLLVPLDDGGDANLVAWVGRVLAGAPSAPALSLTQPLTLTHTLTLTQP